MSADPRAAPAGPAAGRRVPILIGTAAALAFAIWWSVALPVLLGARTAAHEGHTAHVFAHALGGTFMLFAGALALYVGTTRRGFRYHRWIGASYLLGGALGAGTGLALSVAPQHPLPGLGLATGTLAVAWLAVAAMAWRAARNRRFDSHRRWMIRSYVLTFTFVLCRLVMRLPGADSSPETIVAVVWASWITPLIACEIVLQWRSGIREAA